MTEMFKRGSALMREAVQIRFTVSLIPAPQYVVMGTTEIADTIELDIAELIQDHTQRQRPDRR